MTQYARPSSDIDAGAFSATPLYAKLDEASYDDGDYITSTNIRTVTDTCTIGLGAVTDPASSSNHIVRYRYYRTTNNSRVANMTVTLQQGSTTIASWTHTNFSDSAAVQADQTLTAGEADAITDYSQLRLKFDVSMGSGGTGTSITVSITWAVFECPDAPGGTTYEASLSLDKTDALQDSTTSSLAAAVTLDKTDALQDSTTSSLAAAVTLDKTDTLQDSTTSSAAVYNESVALYKSAGVVASSPFNSAGSAGSVASAITGEIFVQTMVVLKDVTGTRVAVFDAWDLLDYTSIRNGVGSYTFSINATDQRINLFQPDTQLEVHCKIPALGIPWFVDFEGFHITGKLVRSEKGDYKFTSTGVDYKDLLKRVYIMYRAGTIRAYKNGPADDVMKAYVEENCGASGAVAEIGRLAAFSYPGFTVDAMTSAGQPWAGDRAFRNLLEVIQEISTKSDIDWNVVGNGPAKFLFTTGQLGEDRSTIGLNASTGLNGAGNVPVLFSVELGNVRSMTSNSSRSGELNVVAVLGEGDNSLRNVVVRRSDESLAASPWNRREACTPINLGDDVYDVTNQMNIHGDGVLKDAIAKDNRVIVPMQQPTCMYNVHYGLGDTITQIINKVAEHKRINKIRVQIGDSGARVITVEFSDVTYE